MIYDKIDTLIAKAMKEQNNDALRLYRLIKSEFTLLETGEKKVNIDEAAELKLLRKMATQREDSIKQYTAAGRPELAGEEQRELDILNSMIPAQPSDEDIVNFTKETIKEYIISKGGDYTVSMKDMKPILTMVQQKYPTANGSLVSNTLKNYR